MSRDGVRRSPVPQLVSDAELNEFPRGMGLRLRGVNAEDEQRVAVWYEDPATGVKTTVGGSATARKDIIKSLQQAAKILESKRTVPRSVLGSTSVFSDTLVGAVARLWRVEVERNGHWTRNGRRKRYSASTLRTKDDIFKAHLAGKTRDGNVVRRPHALLNHAVSKVTTEELQGYFDTDWGHLSDPLKAKLHTLLAAVFDYAKRAGAIGINPMSGVTGYDSRGHKHDDKHLTVDEIRQFLAAIPTEDGEWVGAKVRHANYYRIHIEALLLTALRINELVSLRWRDVVFDDSEPCSSYLVVRQQRQGTTTSGTKTEAGVRNVYLTDRLAADLLVHKESQMRHWESAAKRRQKEGRTSEMNPNPSDLVFTSPWGKPLSDEQFRKVLRRMAQAAGITDRIHPHYLRHVSLTYWADATEGNETVFFAIAGWADSHVRARYVSAPRGRLIHATQVFERTFANKILSPPVASQIASSSANKSLSTGASRLVRCR